MGYKFRTVSPYSRTDNFFKLIDKDWLLVTAGTIKSFNTLTASWGGIGILWERKVAMCVIRPHRYTFEFMERHPAFSLSFFDEKYRKALKLCGKVSGRDIDKVKAAGLTPIEGRKGGIYFDEARMVLECRKIYWHDFDPTHFIEPKLDVFYPDKDYHRLYIGEIVNCLVH